MSEALVVGIVRQAIELAILVSLPMLVAGLVAGVLVSVWPHFALECKPPWADCSRTRRTKSHSIFE